MTRCRPVEHWGVLLVAAWALAWAGCGGRATARPVTGAESPPIDAWERPSRAAEIEPAIRLDRTDQTATEDEADHETVTPRKIAASAGGRSRGDLRIQLRPGMTLYSLARSYQVPLESIMSRNGITDPTSIPAGTVIVIPRVTIPAGESPDPSGAPAPKPGRSKPSKADRRPPAPEEDEDERAPAAMSIAWPIDGLVTGGFGLRGRHHHHEGIDIDGYQGEGVHAGAAGTVVNSGSEGKYGKTVVIDHGNGVSTLYAHASKLLVHEGDRVEQGEAIARVGATGNARGTHLHFEVRRDGRPVDPSPYLESGSVPLGTR